MEKTDEASHIVRAKFIRLCLRNLQMNVLSQRYIEHGSLITSTLITLFVLLETVGWQPDSFTVYLVPLNASPYVALYAAASILRTFEPPLPFVFITTSIVSIIMLVFSCAVYLIFRPDAVAAVLTFWWVPLCSLVGGTILLGACVRAGTS